MLCAMMLSLDFEGRFAAQEESWDATGAVFGARHYLFFSMQGLL